DNDDDKTTGSSITDSGKTSDISLGDGDGDSSTGDIDIIDQPATANCGDGVRDSDEACDDGTPGGGDGCGANCLYVEEGFCAPRQVSRAAPIQNAAMESPSFRNSVIPVL